MEQHQNQENDFSGFMGATGGTGGPGAPGSFGGPANPITYPASTPLSPDELNAKVRSRTDQHVRGIHRGSWTSWQYPGQRTWPGHIPGLARR